MTTLEKISDDLIISIKTKNEIKTSTLRGLKSKITEAEKILGKQLTDIEILGVISKYGKERLQSMDLFSQANRLDLFEIEEKQYKIVEEYLPKRLTTEEVELKVKELIKEKQLVGIKSLGIIMKEFSLNYAGQVDGKEVSEIAKKLL